MRIDPANPPTIERPPVNNFEGFLVRCFYRSWQHFQKIENLSPIDEAAQCELADDERMYQYLVILEQREELSRRVFQVLNPHRGVDQDHDASEPLRRGGASIVFSVPPNLASRARASRAMRASKPA